MSIDVTILGSGTCFPAGQGEKLRAHPGFFIRWGEGDKHLLLDCSAGIAERLVDIGEDPSQIHNVAISHAHPDHCCLQNFLQTCLCHGMRRPGFSWEDKDAFPRLDLYAPRHIIDHLPALNAFYFEDTDGQGLPFPVVRPTVMTERTMAELSGGAWLVSHGVKHGFGKVDAIGLRLAVQGKIIAYSGDTGLCEGVCKAAQNADLFICEASARIGDDLNATTYGHLNPHQAGKIARAAEVKHLVLTHYSGADSDEEMEEDCRMSGFAGELTIAKDGQRFEL